MFKDNTVFIVGAGASAEFGLPVGGMLTNQIKNNSVFELNGYSLRSGISEIYDCIVSRYTKHDAKINACMEAMGEIHRAIDFAGSIDEFINRHSDDSVIAEVGKLQVAYAISEAERLCRLAAMGHRMDHLLFDDFSDTWIKSFAQQLFDGVRNNEIENIGNNITIICFNYDRCIELFLTDAIFKTFRGISYEEAFQIVEQMNIIHPYGSLGKLTDHPFGKKASAQEVRAMSENIVTWSESQRSDIAHRIQAGMLIASTVVFLGFAFAPQNMKLLTIRNPYDVDEQGIETFATAYGYNSVINDRLRSKILDLYSGNDFTVNYDRVHIQYDMKCADFLKAHSMALVV